jgi:hypothetical protein
MPRIVLWRRVAPWIVLAVGLGASAGPMPIPPPLPKPTPPPGASELRSLVSDSDAPWGLTPDLLAPLYQRAAAYAAYARRFTCDEMVRRAEYDTQGSVSKEQIRSYAYLLLRSEAGVSIREYRQELAADGKVKAGEVQDEEPFPPAYMWVFLFSRFNEPYFSYRLVADRFDGFDWVHEIEFKGSLPFTSGKDIREWQGTVLVDAVSRAPIEIVAEPSSQVDRIQELYRKYQSSFNIMGGRSGPPPLGYRAWVQFRYRDPESGLLFPTELRYDTFRAVSTTRVVPVRASIRGYTKYKIFTTEAQEAPK